MSQCDFSRVTLPFKTRDHHGNPVTIHALVNDKLIGHVVTSGHTYGVDYPVVNSMLERPSPSLVERVKAVRENYADSTKRLLPPVAAIIIADAKALVDEIIEGGPNIMDMATALSVRIGNRADPK